MKTVRLDDRGGVDKLRYEDVPISDIAPDEAVLIKCCDTAPAVPGDAPLRKIIEVRALVFHNQGLDG